MVGMHARHNGMEWNANSTPLHYSTIINHLACTCICILPSFGIVPKVFVAVFLFSQFRVPFHEQLDVVDGLFDVV